MDLFRYIDIGYPEGDEGLVAGLAGFGDINQTFGLLNETLLHVAARRRRCSAVEVLAEHGADLNVKNSGGKTPFAHAIRRGFDDVVAVLRSRGVDESLNDADRFAVAMIQGDLVKAESLLQQEPTLACTGNNEEDRILADIAGRPQPERVQFLLDHNASLTATALDGGTALHQACWFGQPENVKMLIEAGAELENFDRCHESSPLGWAVHGSRYSGGAADVVDKYVEIVRLLLDAGAKLHYPDEANSNRYQERLLNDAVPGVRELLL